MITVEMADSYFRNEVLHNEAWVNADLDTKNRALKNAENTLYRYYRTFDRVEKPLPEIAVYEQAYFLLLVDETIQKAALGVTQVSVSGISISVNPMGYPIAPEVRQLMVSYGVGGVRLGRSAL